MQKKEFISFPPRIPLDPNLFPSPQEFRLIQEKLNISGLPEKQKSLLS
jgi:hypothetical protein